jgi:ribosomal protein S18 acetylase RimI-like enzyme
MENILIRKIEEKDVSETAKVYSEAFNAADVDEHWTEKTAIPLINYFVKLQKDLFFVAINRQEIIGGAVGVVKPSDENGHYLTETDLFVSPKYGKNGVAKKLLKTLLEEAIAKYQVQGIGGIANSEVDFPMKWYERIGFKKTRWVYIGGKAEEILKNLEAK